MSRHLRTNRHRRGRSATGIEAAQRAGDTPTSGCGTLRFHTVPRDQLSSTFAALAGSTRRAILARLLAGEASVAELAEPSKMTTRAVSKHIGVLEAAGLVTRGRDAQRRPSRIRVEPLAGIDRCLQIYRRLWNARFDRLDERLQDLQKGKRR
jgi:DNA-binding transcriptional ArsR family regulator